MAQSSEGLPGAADAAEQGGQLRWSLPFMATLVQLLANVLCVSVVNYTTWFAITFFVYLRTGSVFATGVISGVFVVSTVLTGIWFGSLVDHHRKRLVMQWSSAISMVVYAVALALYLLTPQHAWMRCV